MKKGLLVALTLLAIVGGVSIQPLSSASLTTAQAGSSVAIDADPATSQVDALSPPVAVGASTTVSVNIVSLGENFTTIQWQVSFDPTQLDFVSGSGAHVHPDATLCGGFTEGTFDAGPLTGDDFVNSACGVKDPPGAAGSSVTGPVSELDIECVSPGNHALHLVSTTEDATFGTTTIGPSGVHTMTLTDATVACGGGGGLAPTPTATPVGGATPVPTPVGPVATPTPVPPGWEALPLVEGCQFAAWTGDDGMPPADLAGLVGPAGNLRSLWAQQPAPTWRGYSPQFPDVSDMEAVDQLDVVAVCALGPGDFVRPII